MTIPDENLIFLCRECIVENQQLSRSRYQRERFSSGRGETEMSDFPKGNLIGLCFAVNVLIWLCPCKLEFPPVSVHHRAQSLLMSQCKQVIAINKAAL